ncbi:hypothetical protein B0T26DRAFT_799566 [Lasiosphaeria miniovina]|uniref:Uncharacterized protein n=1 Tax=Lasiosphaeria miniovina TaxID=1954250 RepID=A0AA40B4S9_9PEZI|nr:uncharacterized protein B0T26DRAFT_799566 [Lasiosphaeria miniovina]KAK0727588.1 hypothetical protein B0T26DRAFT_799566 [Lasiosphaeria miniovina]
MHGPTLKNVSHSPNICTGVSNISPPTLPTSRPLPLLHLFQHPQGRLCTPPPITMSNPRYFATLFLERLEASQILLVEWETTLLIRFGYPLAPNGSRFFLVPDSQLQKVGEIAAELRLSPVDENTLRSVYRARWRR